MSSQEWLAITRYALGPHIILIGRESVKQRLKNSFRCQICFLPGRRTKESQGRDRGFHGTEVLKQQRRMTVSVFRWWCGPRHAWPPALLSLGQEDRSSQPRPYPGQSRCQAGPKPHTPKTDGAVRASSITPGNSGCWASWKQPPSVLSCSVPGHVSAAATLTWDLEQLDINDIWLVQVHL